MNTHSEDFKEKGKAKSSVMSLRGSREAADALARGANYTDAAEAAGMTTRTLYKRRKDPEFMEYVRERRADIFEFTAGRLTDTSQDAADKLKGLLDSDSEQIALSAARAILEHATRLRELLEIDVRIAAVEKALEAQEGQ